MSGYLTVREVAELARSEHKSVRRAISAGRLRAFKPAGRLLIREEDARAWIESRPVRVAVPEPYRPRQRRVVGRRAQVGSVADLRSQLERAAS